MSLYWGMCQQITGSAPTGGTLTTVISTLTTSGTWTVPAGIIGNSITVYCVGGGGKGSTRSTNGAGSGGGGGAMSSSIFTVATGDNISYTIGAGSTNTSAGGDTYFYNNTTLLAKGGNSVNNNSNIYVSGGLATSGIGTNKYSGGYNAIGTAGSYGGGGGSAASIDAGGNYTTNTYNTRTGGAITNSLYSSTGGAGSNGAGVGNIGTGYGAGGGGALRNASGTVNGAAGTNGVIIITYQAYLPTITNFLNIGCAYAPLVITGTYFSGATSVKFGGTSASSYTVNSNTQITATPTTSTTGTISITTPAGTATSSGTYTINPQPTAGDITGTNTVCVGSIVTLSPNASGNSPFTYTWSSSNNGLATVTNAGVVTGVAAGSPNITYTVTDVNGCTKTSNNFAVTVKASPTPTFTTQPSGNVNVNTNVTYTTQASQSNYLWTLTGTENVDYIISSGGIGTSSNTVTLQWKTTGSKTVTVNYQNSNGCYGVSPASNTITVI